MPYFAYKALRCDGQLVQDTIEAASRASALALLAERQLTLLQFRASSAMPSLAEQALEAGGRRLPRRTVEIFTRGLSALLAAGVPLASALRRLAKDGSNKAAATTWDILQEAVSNGTSLADSMARFPRVFSRVYTAMVRAGEAGGFLDIVLDQIAEFQSKDRDLKARVSTALVYPCVLAVLATAVVVFLLVYFIPRFEAMFADFGAVLPALTRGIIALSGVLKHWGLPAGAALLVAMVMLRQYLDTTAGRRRWEGLVLRVPVLGRLLARFAMVRFCRMLGTLTGAGVSLITALTVARESLGNQVLVDAVQEAILRVQRGERLADSLALCPQLFPGAVLEIIGVAEDSGRLDAELVRLAATAEKDLDRELQRAVALAEPAMLFVMAAIIGTIVIGMVLPIFTLQDYIR
ncbi:MAG: type II secretion system F family protein [Lentisphaeria bacterium]|nr:type II secretion system F family protein [Lentisphaeria bacterium]